MVRSKLTGLMVLKMEDNFLFYWIIIICLFILYINKGILYIYGKCLFCNYFKNKIFGLFHWLISKWYILFNSM